MNMRLTIILRKYYLQDDDGVDENCTVQLRDEVKDKVILSGDNYHDKIDEQINGFIKGLKYADVHVRILESIYTY